MPTTDEKVEQLSEDVRELSNRMDKIQSQFTDSLLINKDKTDDDSTTSNFPWKWLIVAGTFVLILMLATAGYINWDYIAETVGWTKEVVKR